MPAAAGTRLDGWGDCFIFSALLFVSTMKAPDTPTFYPTSRKKWRQWLEKNHDRQASVWVIFYKKDAGMPTLSWSEAVDEALCFGWVDSKRKPVDEQQFIQFFSRRKPKGTWSKINKEKVEALTAQGLMRPAGLASIEAARQNGSWSILDEVETLAIPEDLEAAFARHTGSKDYFLSLSKSVRKMMLQWLVLARRAETREKRVNEIAVLAAQGLKPKGM